MAATVRAKFFCGAVADGQVQLTAVYSGSAENREFFEATPAGSIQLSVVSPSTRGHFVPGKEYYVDFTPAGENS